MGLLFSDREEMVLGTLVSVLHRKVDQFLGDRVVVRVRRGLRALEQRVHFIPCKNAALVQVIRVEFQDLYNEKLPLDVSIERITYKYQHIPPSD